MISYNTPLLDSPRRGDRNCLVNFIASIGILIEVGAIFSIFAGHDNYLWIYLILKPIPVVLLANIPTTTLLSTSARRMTPLNALLAIFYLALCTTNLVLLIGGTLDMHAGRAVVRGCLTHVKSTI